MTPPQLPAPADARYVVLDAVPRQAIPLLRLTVHLVEGRVVVAVDVESGVPDALLPRLLEAAQRAAREARRRLAEGPGNG